MFEIRLLWIPPAQEMVLNSTCLSDISSPGEVESM